MRRVDGAKVTRLTPGDLLICRVLGTLRGVPKDKQKSAEAIVAAAYGSEGPNLSCQARPTFRLFWADASEEGLKAGSSGRNP